MKIGQNIKAWRRARGLTQEQLSEMTGIGRANLSRLEMDQIAYTQRSLEAISGALGVEVGALLMSPPEDGAPEFFRAVEAPRIAGPSSDHPHDAKNDGAARRRVARPDLEGDQHSVISEAIAHGIAAAACRKAASVVTESREEWSTLAKEESEEAARLLDECTNQVDVYVLEAETDPEMASAARARAEAIYLRGERTGCTLNWPDDIARTIRIAMAKNTITIKVEDDKTHRLYWGDGPSSAFMGLVERVSRGSWVFRPSPARVRAGERALVTALANAILAENILQKEIGSGTNFW